MGSDGTGISPPGAQLSASSRRNYSLFVIEGGCLFGATYFANHQTVLPSLILEQNGPEWLAALAPSLMTIGLFTAPIFTHRLIDRLHRYHGFTNFWVFFQRLTFLIGALLLFRYATQPLAVIWILVLTPLLSGVFGGIPLAAWQQLFMKTLPAHQRASNMALRFLVGGIIGIAAGKVIEATLSDCPGAIGYAWLHLWAGISAIVGWLAFAFIRETPVHSLESPEFENPTFPEKELLPSPPQTGWLQILLNPKLRNFWIGLILMHTIMITIPFYAVAIRDRFEESIAFLGVLSVWQMAGFMVGNLCAVLLGHKFSGRQIFQTGLLMMAVVLVPGVFSQHLLTVKLAYFAFSFFLMVAIIGKDTYILESAPPKKRSLFLSLASLVTMLCMLIFPMISYVLWSKQQNLTLLAVPVLVSLPFAVWKLNRPRLA